VAISPKLRILQEIATPVCELARNDSKNWEMEKNNTAFLWVKFPQGGGILW
jgi:hypothetical protein